MWNKIFGYQIPILMYHRIIKKTEKCEYPWSVNEVLFEEQMDYLNKNGYKSIFLSELGNININKPKEKYIILTADDGYADNYELMYPILKKYKIKMNIFLISGKKYNSWDCEEKTKNYPKAYLMQDFQIRSMQESGLIEFGLHGKNHKNLSKLTDKDLYEEVVVAKNELEEKLNGTIITMTYPHGGYNEKVREFIEKNGIKYACTSEIGSQKIQDDFLTMRRIDINNSDDVKKFKKKISGYYYLILEKKIDITRFIARIIN